MDDPRFQTDKERIEAFTARSGRHRRQWYNLKKKVMKRIRMLRSTAPEPDHADLEAMADELDQYQPESIPHGALHQ